MGTARALRPPTSPLSSRRRRRQRSRCRHLEPKWLRLYLSVSLSLSLSPSVSVLCCFLSTTTNGRRKWKRMESRSRKKTSVPLLCCTRHKEKIEDCDYPRRCHKRRSALVPIACLQLVGSVLFLCTSSQGLQ